MFDCQNKSFCFRGILRICDYGEALERSGTQETGLGSWLQCPSLA